MFAQAEHTIRSTVEWLRLLVETLGVLVIAAGVAVAVAGLVRHMLSRCDDSFIPVRLHFARYLTLALELQLAADILSTSVAPTWERIGKLAAIAVIRTALNYFLNKEIEHERSEEKSHATTAPAAPRNG